MQTPQAFNVRDYGAVDDGSTDCTTAFRNAIADALAYGRTLVIPRVTGSGYRITDTLTIGATATAGLHVLGVGKPTILWGGSGAKPMILLQGMSDTLIENLRVDGNKVAGVTGIYQTATAAAGRSQQVTYYRSISQLRWTACASISRT
jgi:hypothetical protein